MVGVLPLVDHLDTARGFRMRGAHARLIVRRAHHAGGIRGIHHLDRLDREFTAVLSYFSEPDHYALGPDEYLEHLGRLKRIGTFP